MSVAEDVAKLEPCALLVEVWNGIATVEDCMAIPRKIKTVNI